MLFGGLTLIVVSRQGEACHSFAGIARFLVRSRTVFYQGVMNPIPPPSAPPRAVATPCVKVCVVDGASGLCLGCFRTLAEIGGWSGLTDAERARIMGELEGRKALLPEAFRG